MNHRLRRLERLTGRYSRRFQDMALTWLILSVSLDRAMFHGNVARFTTTQLNRFADEGVRVFLAAYRSSGGAGVSR